MIGRILVINNFFLSSSKPVVRLIYPRNSFCHAIRSLKENSLISIQSNNSDSSLKIATHPFALVFLIFTFSISLSTSAMRVTIFQIVSLLIFALLIIEISPCLNISNSSTYFISFLILPNSLKKFSFINKSS